MRVLPVGMGHFMQAVNHIFIPYLDGTFPPAVETAGSQIDRPYDPASVVREEQFGMQLKPLELVDFDSDVVENPQSANAFEKLFFFQLVGRTGHHVDLNATLASFHQSLDDDRVLVALILQP